MLTTDIFVYSVLVPILGLANNCVVCSVDLCARNSPTVLTLDCMECFCVIVFFTMVMLRELPNIPFAIIIDSLEIF